MQLRTLAVGLFCVTCVPLAGGGSGGGAITTLDVNGVTARIYRDAFGVPHIFAESNQALFAAYGYVVAQDRLWQLEMNRRASQGRLAELFGNQPLSGDFLGVPENALVTADAADQNARTQGYTDGELDQQFAQLSAEQQEAFASYATGINRYLTEVVAPDPDGKLPYEFHYVGLSFPERWIPRDVMRVSVFLTRLFGDSGGAERANQTLLNNLTAAALANGDPDPVAAGLGMLNDLRWVNDPESPTTIPTRDPVGRRQRVHQPTQEQLVGTTSDEPESLDKRATAFWRAAGVPTGVGSYGWAVSPTKSSNGAALFLGAPGLGFSAPQLIHEVQLTGGNDFHITGIGFPGVPFVVIGRTDRIAWTQMTANADNVDTYVETLCGGGMGYLFDGGCVPYESRVEIINVKGASPIALTVRRSVHGPVVGSGPNVRFARRRAQWKREVDYIKAVFGASRARNLDEFRFLVEQRSGVAGVLYADTAGNIAFWLAGWLPERTAGFDTRFPLPGNGSAEWTGARLPVPVSINPAQGWLTNWNNKPSVDFDALEGGGLGRFNRVLDITSLLDGPSLLSPDGMNGIVRDVARVDVVPTGPGRQARFLKPYLLRALDAVPPVHPLAPEARTILEKWDGSAISDAVTSASLEPGYVIFKKWLAVVLQDVFGDELKGTLSQASANVLLHVLDDALRHDGPCADLGGSCVPPSRDYLNGQDANEVLSRAFDQAIADPSVWTAQPRAPITFSHFLIGPMAQMPGMARMTWAQNLVLAHPISGETILGLGESGFIKSGDGGVPVPDPHFADQLQLYQNFGYKPMPLYRNWQLEP